jgi:hypothetical protein
MSDYQYYFMDRNGLWSERCQEVVEKGLKNASPIARLIYSCETGQGIDQHASEDLKAVSAALQAAADALAARDAAIEAVRQYAQECRNESKKEYKELLNVRWAGTLNSVGIILDDILAAALERK